jgi:hypothetical protein
MQVMGSVLTLSCFTVLPEEINCLAEILGKFIPEIAKFINYISIRK